MCTHTHTQIQGSMYEGVTVKNSPGVQGSIHTRCLCISQQLSLEEWGGISPGPVISGPLSS